MTSSGVANVPPMYPYALPPEFFTSGVGAVQSDIYQVGLTLYRAANGDPLFRQQIPSSDLEVEQMTTSGRFPNRNEFLPHVCQGLRRVIRRALRLEIDRRYASAPDFADALARVDVPLDWAVLQSAGGEIEWCADRVKRPSLSVRLLPDGNRWRYEMHTKNNGACRAHAKSQWKGDLTRRQAFNHLKQLFQMLG